MLNDYYKNMDVVFQKFLNDKENLNNITKAINFLKETKEFNSRIYLIGNGGSASVAEHIAIDLTKNAGLKAMGVSGAPMLTTFANDYGYENVFKKFIEVFGETNDILIAISSSGTSKNILNACDEAKRKNMKVITLSGFLSDNPLRTKGEINFWIESKSYGFLEILHGLILH
ncbi:MAG: SIS domain-containing protein, partial [Candidatus Omnitrophica bacterium]|nr:SIS domain-containing protein [Candidatus Omnitrophota bacterium]